MGGIWGAEAISKETREESGTAELAAGKVNQKKHQKKKSWGWNRVDLEKGWNRVRVKDRRIDRGEE